MSILSAENLNKKFKLKEVVKNISFDIKSGEVVGLLGPNGAGKTTAFYMVVGLIEADKGKVILDGKDITALPAGAAWAWLSAAGGIHIPEAVGRQ